MSPIMRAEGITDRPRSPTRPLTFHRLDGSEACNRAPHGIPTEMDALPEECIICLLIEQMYNKGKEAGHHPTL